MNVFESFMTLKRLFTFTHLRSSFFYILNLVIEGRARLSQDTIYTRM